MVGVARAGSPRQFSLFPRAASIPAAEEFLRPLHSFVSTAFRKKDQLAEMIGMGFRKSKNSSIVLVAESEVTGGAMGVAKAERSEERRVGKECRSRWSPYH